VEDRQTEMTVQSMLIPDLTNEHGRNDEGMEEEICGVPAACWHFPIPSCSAASAGCQHVKSQTAVDE
jgi:hypothetical protein